MAINETIVTGRKFRKLIDIINKTWQRISFWTHSSDVEFNDGKNAETKVGAIDGITDSLASTSSRIAASAKAVSTLNNNLSGVSFHPESDGLYAEYMVGADAVRKKLGSLELDTSNVLASGKSINYTTTKSYSLLILVSASGSITGSNQIPSEHSLTAPGFINIAKTQATGITTAIGERVMLFVSVRANVPNGTVVTASVNGLRNALALIGV